MAFIDSGVHIVKNGKLITPTMKLHPDLYGKYNEDVAESYKYLYDQSVEAYKNGNPYCSHPFDKCYYFCNAMTEYSKRRRNILKAFKLQGNQYFFHADKACYLKN